jgi:methylmalonyl-CoA mutase, N-terminal domain
MAPALGPFARRCDDGRDLDHARAAALERKQVERLRAAKAARDSATADATLAAVKETAETRHNLMPALIEAARAGCSEGEIVQALQQVWGDYRELPSF